MRSRPVHVVLFAGTRPEAIKLAPIALAARGMDDIAITLVHSGQQERLFEDGLRPFGLSADHALACPSRSSVPEEMVAAIQAALGPLLAALAPDMVVVQGDTSSALAGALTAHRLGIPVAHVEAGLRSHDPALPWPEEINRCAIARIADLNLAPSEGAAANLRDEAVPGRIHVVGNPGIDALLLVRRSVQPELRADGRRRIVVTAHRREVIGAPLDRVARAVRTIAGDAFDRDVTVLLHRNPAGAQLREALHGVSNVTLQEALPFPAMIGLLAGADLVLSDSGGLQEECAALGLPLLVLRDNTERPEVIAMGAALLVGTDTRGIVEAAHRLLSDEAARLAMSVPRFPYGDGHAAPRILDLLATFPHPLG